MVQNEFTNKLQKKARKEQKALERISLQNYGVLRSLKFQVILRKYATFKHCVKTLN